MEKLWPECIKTITGFVAVNPYKDALQKFIHVDKQVNGNVFGDMQVSEMEELLEEHGAALTGDDCEKLTKFADEEEDEDEVPSKPKGITIEKLPDVFHQVKKLKDVTYDMDPSMIRSLKFGRLIDAAAVTYQHIFDEINK